MNHLVEISQFQPFPIDTEARAILKGDYDILSEPLRHCHVTCKCLPKSESGIGGSLDSTKNPVDLYMHIREDWKHLRNIYSILLQPMPK